MSDTQTDDQTESETGAEAGPEAGPEAPTSTRSNGTDLVQEGDVAADYLEGLLDILDIDGDIDIDVENDRAVLAIIGEGLGSLVGPQGAVLDALQELTRLAVTAQTGARSRLMLDIAGHRAARKETLTRQGTEAAERVAANGEPERLRPMTPFERKVVHDAVALVEGVRSESEGEEPERRVVILPA